MTVVDVTQEDRDAAANLIEHKCLPGDLTPTNIRIGNLDDGFAVQAFARHRLARPAPDGEPVGITADMPGSDGGFSMAVFEAHKVPIGSTLYAHPPRNDAVVEALREALQEAVAWDGYDDEGVPAVWLKQAQGALASLKQGEA